MSKASEWAKRRRDAEREQPMYYNNQKGIVALVNTLGHLEFRAACVEAPEAAAFARWILDAFGDEP